MDIINDNGRYTKFLDLLPKNNYNVTKTAIEAGFAPNTARTQQKRIMQKALRVQMERVNQLSRLPTTDSKMVKRTMLEIVGMSKENAMERLRFIATQDKDLASALKVLGPLVKEEGIHLSTEDQPKVTVPILNVTVKDRLVEPLNPSSPDERRTTHIVRHDLDEGDGGVESTTDGLADE